MHQSKNRSGRANAQRQGQHRGDRERRGLSQAPQGVARILCQRFQKRQSFLSPIVLLHASTPPNFSTACRRASVGDKPARRFSAVCIARCSSISARKRSSSCWVLAQELSRFKNRRRGLILDLPPSE